METKRKPAERLRNSRKPKLIIPKTRGNATLRIIPDDGARVTVACKFPMGLRLRIFEMIDTVERGPTGTFTTKVAQQIGGPENTVTIKGYNKSAEHFQSGIVHAGFALTHDVPKQFFDLWMKQNAGSDLVQNGLIFAHREERSVKAQVIDHEGILCGLEPIQPTPPGSPWGPPPKAIDPRLKGLRMAPTTMGRDD